MKPLIIFELANNHQGSLDHAIKIVSGLAEIKAQYTSIFDFAIKFQFRNLDTFLDPTADFASNKHIARFYSTQLTENQWVEIIEEVKLSGFQVVTTPFDEESVDKALRLGITTLKIASCSAQDWPLLQRVCNTPNHLIVSTAGLVLDEIDALYSYLRHECRGGFTLLHCVGLYPAPPHLLNLSTIGRFVERFPRTRIGYSGHEPPNAHHVSTLALALGAEVFERHVGLRTAEFPLNTYSLNLTDVANWLLLMSDAVRILGEPKGSNRVNEEEQASLRSLRRGVFATVDIPEGQGIDANVVSFRFPLREQQTTVANFSTIYHRYYSTRSIRSGEPLNEANTRVVVDKRSKTLDGYVQRIRGIAAEAHVDISDDELLEISHHAGVENLWRYGCCIVNVLNRSYCKKLILMVRGQEHPEQLHKVKEETLRVVFGELEIVLEGNPYTLKEGNSLVIAPNATHSFRALTDVVIEELSTTSMPTDSYYTDVRISSLPRTARKSIVRNLLRSTD